LQIQPSSPLVANLTQTCGFGVVAQVDLCGVLHEQDNGLHLNVFAGLLPVRLHEGLKGDIVFIEQAIQGHHILPGLHLGRQGGRGILSHATSRLDGSSRSPNILEPGRPERLLGPAFWVQEVLRVHLSILAVC
jgi:hypothetical protein